MARALNPAPARLALLLAACGAPPERPLVPPLTPRAPAPLGVDLRPVCEPGGAPTALDVTVTLDPWDERPPFFSIRDPEGEPPMRRRLADLRLRDDLGELPVRSESDVDPRDGERKLGVAGLRAGRGKLQLRYRILSISTAERGPRFGLRHDENGLGGTAGGFLLVPRVDGPRRVEVRWIVAGCDPALTPISALGAGAGPHALDVPPDGLRQAGFYLGRVSRFDHDEGDLHLRFSFVGRPAFDMATASRYARDVLRAERAAFGDADPTPFHALMRVLPEMKGSVTGGGNAFGYTSVVGPEAPWNARMREHVAHELAHHWIGVSLWLRDPDGVSGYWFSEGFTTHYATVIPLRAGLVSPDETLAHLNAIAAAFYPSPHRGASNKAIEDYLDRGAGDAGVRLVPYHRGSAYAAELDAAIRARSGGARSVDDVVRELLARARTAKRNEAGFRELPDAAFLELVRAELGEEGARRFEAVVRRGELPRAPGNAYGPCFDRRDQDGKVDWVRVPGVPDARCGER